MASSLQEFYEIRPEDVEIVKETMTVEAVNGKEYEVEVKGLPYQQFTRTKVLSTYGYESPSNGQAVSQVEELTFCLKLCAAGIVTPPLNNAELRRIHKVHDSESLVTRLFPPQSILAMGSKIAQLSLNSEDVVKDEEGNIVIDSGVNPEKLEEAKN